MFGVLERELRASGGPSVGQRQRHHSRRRVANNGLRGSWSLPLPAARDHHTRAAIPMVRPPPIPAPTPDRPRRQRQRQRQHGANANANANADADAKPTPTRRQPRRQRQRQALSNATPTPTPTPTPRQHRANATPTTPPPTQHRRRRRRRADAHANPDATQRRHKYGRRAGGKSSQLRFMPDMEIPGFRSGRIYDLVHDVYAGRAQHCRVRSRHNQWMALSDNTVRADRIRLYRIEALEATNRCFDLSGPPNPSCSELTRPTDVPSPASDSPGETRLVRVGHCDCQPVDHLILWAMDCIQPVVQSAELAASLDDIVITTVARRGRAPPREHRGRT